MTTSPAGPLSLLAAALALLLSGPAQAEEAAPPPSEVAQAEEAAPPPSVEAAPPPSVVAQAEEAAPLASAERWRLVEPLGLSPSPWAALSARFDAGMSLDGETGWTTLGVHVPVARHYGAVDARLAAHYDQEGLASLGPEFVLRGLPLQLADGRGVLGFSFTFIPLFQSDSPQIVLGGGLMGGFVGERWFAWAHLGARAEILDRGRPELESTVAFGLRLPRGFRPQVELDLRWEMHEQGELSLAVRPGLRYWPAEFIGVGLSADIWALGPGVEASALRVDVVFHARE